MVAVTYWLCAALPFGSTSSVFAFNSVSRALERAICEKMAVLTTSYVDDYPTVDVLETAKSATLAMEGFLRLLGWKFVDAGNKYHSYAKSFKLLGVQVTVGADDVTVENLPDRLQSIQAGCDALVDQTCWKKAELESLLGRCNFARSYAAGKPLVIPMSTLYDAMSQQRPSIVPTPAESHAVALIRSFAASCVPRIFKRDRPQTMAIMYTDGACEGSGSSFGGVLFLPGQVAQVFEGQVPEHLVLAWRRRGISHAIAQVELLPVALALKTWAGVLRGLDLLLFTDNVSAKEGLVRGTSKNLASRELLLCISGLLVELGGRTWVSRVPSASNPADAPSRGKTAELGGWTDYRKVCVVWPTGL